MNERTTKESDLLEGDIVITLPIAPASLQASRKKKDAVTAAIRDAIKDYYFILTGDVQIEIEWHIHEQQRYESHLAPDIDNIVKPVLDALCGPKGVLINDCQVQFISCHWVDWTNVDQKLTIRIHRQFEDEWLIKDGLAFVKLKNCLCFPLLIDALPSDVLKGLLEYLEGMLELRHTILEKGLGYYAAISVMPSQRFFHILHVQEFPIIDIKPVAQ